MKLSVVSAVLAFLLPPAMAAGQVPGGCQTSIADAAGKPGCYFDGQVTLAALPARAFWHIDVFPTLEEARAAATPSSYAAVIFGKAYLQTVNADQSWRPQGGTRVSTIGPFPVVNHGMPQTARFMEADTTTDMVARVHVHSGTEAWYLIEGGQCLETPKGASRTTQGQSFWIEAGPPMQLSNGGDNVRKALVLVVHPANEAWITMTMDWQPKGLCKS